MFSNDYQVQAMEKDAAKLKARREQNEIRCQRFQNSRLRIIGIDVEGLNAQVEEKRRMQSDKDELYRQERIHTMEMERVLEEAALEEKRNLMLQNNDLKESWTQAMITKRAIPREYETDYDTCGVASAQGFKGEDNDRGERLRFQQDQMRQWINEKNEESSMTRLSEAEEERRWAEHVRETILMREEAENREIALMKAHIAEVKQTNLNMAEMHQATMRGRYRGPEATSIEALHSEDVTKAMDEYGRVTRRDMFKGFTAAQKRRIMQENDVIMRMRREVLYSEQKEDEAWMLQQLAQSRAMEQVLYEERRLRDEAVGDQLSTLAQQMAEAEERKRAQRADRTIGIPDEFFNRFGKDCR